MDKFECSLCNHETQYLTTFRNKDFYNCKNCGSIQLEPQFYLSLESEKARYELHNNNIFDLGYQKFVKPITDYVLNNHSSEQLGLDFGAGHGPVISNILKNNDFKINIYDPFFFDDKDLLELNYDYIVSCEVIEHFHNPRKEFTKLFSMLKPGGSLVIMTEPFSEEIDFYNWYYKNDETHVFFYSQKTFEYIKKTYRFKKLIIDKRLIVFIK